MSNSSQIDRALKVLKLRRGASLKDIEKAYKKLALKYHPDICAGKKKSICKEKFIQINIARKILQDHHHGKYKLVSNKKTQKRVARYKEYISHVKQFYDGWWGDLDF